MVTEFGATVRTESIIGSVLIMEFAKSGFIVPNVKNETKIATTIGFRTLVSASIQCWIRLNTLINLELCLVPTYEYICNECELAFEAVQSFSDEPISICPACGKGVRKVYSNVGVVFKGSGFYKTDSRKAASASTTSTSTTSSTPAPAPAPAPVAKSTSTD
jgi:putative FmdB family regulatory protein